MATKFKSTLRTLALLALTAVCGVLMVASGSFLYLAPQLPQAETYRNVQLETPLRIYTADGKLIDENGNRRNPINFEELPAHVKNAVVASEDPSFYTNSGIDIKGLVRGFWGFISGAKLGGGSTITMQLSKNISFGDDNRYARKLKEILFSLRIQQELTKEEIITLHLNVIYFGSGAYGIGAAAFIYYGKSVSELTLAEAAMMSSLLPAPSNYHPLVSPEGSIIRRNEVLREMHAEGFITQAEYNEATDTGISARRYGRNIDVPAPYVAEMVRQELYELYGDDIYSKGFEVITTIDSKKQLAANAALTNGLEEHYDTRHGFRGPEKNFPADILEPIKYWSADLKGFSRVGNQHPAIVTSVDHQSINALQKNGQIIRIEWDGLSWARPYITQDNAWPPPKTAGDIVETGDLIRIKKTDEGKWSLGQIPDIQGALVSVSPSNGGILALVGGYDFRRSQVNRVETSRPPGSNFKPFVYGAAIESGYSANTLINDAPLIRDDYRPQNDDGKYVGPITLRNALKRSRNVPTVKLFEQLTSSVVLPFAQKLGLPAQNFPRSDLTVALGSQDVKPLEMVIAYSTFANGGYKVDPTLIKQVKNLSAGIIPRPLPPTVCENCSDVSKILNGVSDNSGSSTLQEAPIRYPIAPRILEPEVAFIMNKMLRAVVTEGSGRRVNREFTRTDLMGKTGTTNSAQELWFTGFNRDVATTVYIGFDQPKPLGEREQGASVAVPIWIDYMQAALAGTPENQMDRPDNMVERLVDKDTGQSATPGDDNTYFEFFRAENAPEERDSLLTEANPDENKSPLSTETIF